MRQSGILMHVSSLPSTQGIGKIGEGAYAFVDFLVDSGVSVWQILPLTPTSYGDSPYQSFSVFAGNPVSFNICRTCCVTKPRSSAMIDSFPSFFSAS